MHKNSEFIVIENFLTEEESDYLYNFAMKNCEIIDRGETGRYGFYPLGGKDILEGHRINNLDDSKILSAVNYAFNFFKERYSGEITNLELNRIHFNIMFKDAFLDNHTDEDPNMENLYDGKKKSYILGIFLNDDYEGGEFDFEDQGECFIPKKGSLVLFPGWCTRHGVRPIKNGERVNILTVFHDILA